MPENALIVEIRLPVPAKPGEKRRTIGKIVTLLRSLTYPETKKNFCDRISIHPDRLLRIERGEVDLSVEEASAITKATGQNIEIFQIEDK